MRIALVTLSLTTVAFAASTAYFARELHVERSRPAAEPRLAQVATAAPLPAFEPRPAPAPAAAPASATTSRNATVAMVAAPNAVPITEAQIQAQQRQYMEEMLARLQDPEQREEILSEYKMVSRNSNPRIAQALQLTSEEYDRLIELLAIGQVNSIETSAHCSLDPECLAHGIGRREPDWKAQEIANLLGPARQQKYDEYRNSIQERESVSQLRERLDDAAYLADGQAEALIRALADERQRITSDAGGGFMGFGNGSGMAFVTVEAGSPEERFKSAQENSQRLRARAAEVLTPEQLRIFNEMQDEVVLSARQQLRQKQNFAAVSAPLPD
ncbi:MAG TPA: hypothetical protein VFU13_24195 [Steroidobacteraceae bacterium]|nr:hypothetical protein [Steroidobacteraceae bacterium]